MPLAMNFTERFGFKATNPNLQSAAIMVDKFINRYVKNDRSKGTWRIIGGTVGVGKTMLSRCIIKAAATHAADVKGSRNSFHSMEFMNIRWPEVGSDITSDRDFGPVLVRVTACDLIIIDDVGSETDAFRANRPASRLQSILDRCENKWLVITTNLPDSDYISTYGERVDSRLKRAVSVWIESEDYRGKLNEKKAN